MTPSDLHTLIADVPEVVPSDLTYRRVFTDEGFHWWFHGVRIDPLHAADLIAGEAKRRMPQCVSGRTSAGMFFARADEDRKVFYGATELEALLAAYRASKAPRSHGEAKQA